MEKYKEILQYLDPRYNSESSYVYLVIKHANWSTTGNIVLPQITTSG